MKQSQDSPYFKDQNTATLREIEINAVKFAVF